MVGPRARSWGDDAFTDVAEAKGETEFGKKTQSFSLDMLGLG